MKITVHMASEACVDAYTVLNDSAPTSNAEIAAVCRPASGFTS